MLSLTHKVAIIAGGGGIGSAVATKLAAAGAAVVIGDLNVTEAEATTKEITRAGGIATARHLDIAESESVEDFFDAVAVEFGRLDLLHVNAADLSPATYGRDVDLVAAPMELFDHMMAVNLRGHLLCTRAAIPRMLREGGGSIVYTSSLAAFVGNPRAFYSMSKAALGALARSVAHGWGVRGIRANLVAPGFVPTAAAQAVVVSATAAAARSQALLTPRPPAPSDIANAVAYLLSDESHLVQGQVLHVNGGIYMG